MAIVFRVENAEGKGPYQGFTIWCRDYTGYGNDVKDPWIRDSHGDTDHPQPYQDGLHMTDEWFCGFSDLDQLDRWFTNQEIFDLLRHGFMIVEIEAEEAKYGDYQAIFKGRKSTKVFLESSDKGSSNQETTDAA